MIYQLAGFVRQPDRRQGQPSTTHLSVHTYMLAELLSRQVVCDMNLCELL
jgi:hypothetical protein